MSILAILKNKQKQMANMFTFFCLFIKSLHVLYTFFCLPGESEPVGLEKGLI